MAFNVSKSQILHGFLASRLFFRAFLFASALTIFLFLQLFRDVEPTELFAVNSNECALNVVGSNRLLFPSQFMKDVSYAVPFLPSVSREVNANFTLHLFRDLMDKELLKSGAKALCVGEGSASAASVLQQIGFSDALGIDRHPFFSFSRKSFIYTLEFKDNSFDFVFSRALDRVSVPALLVLEIERVLRPGGVGAMLVCVGTSNPGSLIKSATPVSSFLKSSDVIHVSSISSFTLIAFKKRFDCTNSFEHYQLPDECPSVTNNKPFMEYLEPLSEEKPVGVERNVSYLTHFMDTSSRKRLIYIDIGAGDSINSSATNWSMPFYPAQSRAFDVYVVDHDTSVLSSYVKKPGVTFVYHPDLAGNKVTASPVGDMSPLFDEGFDFLVWFKETVSAKDFVVLKMNARGVELKLLFELFESGAICLVDELFLHCSDSIPDEGAKHGDCGDLFKGLRSKGVFVHQWLWRNLILCFVIVPTMLLFAFTEAP